MNPHPAAARISIVARSPETRPEQVECVVTLPTFRRPELVVKTLDSLVAQHTARSVAVIVMDNDAEAREGAQAARHYFDSGLLDGLVIIAHDRGNCSAYNAGWHTALVTYPNFRHLLVIDDDEAAEPQWIETMCATAERLGADIVGGPQIPHFPRPGDSSWARHPVFAPPYRRTGRVPALYSSGNLLVSKEVLAEVGAPFLDTRFNFMGGGDSDFLSRAEKMGFRLGWCAEAPVHEEIPARRLEADWVRQRSLRNGVISTLVEKRRREDEPAMRFRVLVKSLALLIASLPRGFLKAVRLRLPSAFPYPFYVAVGRLLAETGYTNEQYREPEKN